MGCIRKRTRSVLLRNERDIHDLIKKDTQRVVAKLIENFQSLSQWSAGKGMVWPLSVTFHSVERLLHQSFYDLRDD